MPQYGRDAHLVASIINKALGNAMIFVTGSLGPGNVGRSLVQQLQQ